MFYGNAQSIVFVRNLLEILKSGTRLYTIHFDQSIWECNGHVDDWFSNTKALLCGIWNLRGERLYPSGSSDLVLHSSINQCVVNGRDAMAAHS